jgi:CBS domain-containing protein
MQVKEIMSADVATCRPDANLSEVARIMWDRDCGFVPVVDESGRLCGVITDRDICIASATRGRAPQKISVRQVMHAPPIQTAAPEDTIEGALAAIQRARVRRLPVVSGDGRLAGVISMNDIVLASHEFNAPPPADIMSTLSAICAHRGVLTTV